MEKIKIKAEARTEKGTGAVRRLRRTGMIPGSVMKMKKGGTELIKLPAHDFMMAMRGHASKQLLVTLDMNGTEVPALMREMQNDVLAGTPIHVDFSEVSLAEKVRVTVPLYLVGEAVGVKLGGGVLEQVLRTIEVDCLPTDIAEKFEVDVSKLGLDQTLFVRDLQLGDKQTIVTRGELADFAKEAKGVKFYAGANSWQIADKIDAAFPCARQNELNGEDADYLLKHGCKLVGEGANMPSTPEAIEKFLHAKIMFSPGKASNAGGVATSGLEMSQNSERLSWSAEEVDNKLKGIMKSIHDNAYEAAAKYGHKGNYVMGANIAGFVKVADAMVAQGVC